MRRSWSKSGADLRSVWIRKLRVHGFPICALLVAMCCGSSGDGAEARTNVVTVLVTRGSVEYKRHDQPNWDPVQKDQRLYPGDRLRTGENSDATLEMYDLQRYR